MCLTIPKKVIAVNEKGITVKEIRTKKIQEVGSIIKVKKNDWVLTQNNVIINKITPAQAREINNLFNSPC